MMNVGQILNDAADSAREYIDRSLNTIIARDDARSVLSALAEIESDAPGAFMYVPSIERTYHEGARAEISVHLADGAPKSIVRALVSALGIKDARKAKTWGGDSLHVIFTYRSVRVVVYGYVPQTCRVEYDEVVVPASPEHTIRKSRIVCEPITGDTPAEEL